MYFRRDDKISVETNSVTLADLKIEGVEYQQLVDLDIFESIHHHGVCKLVLVVDEKFDNQKILSWNKTQIKVKADKDIIFCGIISQCVIEERIDAKYLTVTARTLSCQLESARKSQTFQNAGKKFSDMLSVVEKEYSPAEITCAKDDTVAEMIYRDNLTDWEFLMELAESHGQILFTDSKSDKLRISLGFKAFKEFEADDSMKLLQQSVSIDFYKRLEANTYEGARSCYFVETNFSTYNVNIGVGHGVNYDNQLQAVIVSHITVYEHVLQNKITIRYAEGCRADAWDVVKYFDRFYYINGKVLESKDTNVKVQFDCDEKQDKNEALDIPYESAVSNYLYTMPDVDDKVFVYVDHIRQAAMGSLRAKEVSDEYTKRSFKTKDSALILEPNKMEFNAAEKTLLDEEDGIKFATPKDIIFSCKGDLIIQSAQGMVPDNQLTMAATHMAGYAQYLAGLGQPATVQFNPAGSTVGKVTSQITSSGSKAESVELSDLAKELDKLTGRQNKSSEGSKSGGGGGGGSIKLEAKDSALVQVSDSSIEMKGSNLNVKTPALMQVATIPMAGGGKGSGGIGGGNPKNRSEKINVEHGQEDRSRVKEEVTATPDDKSISR